MVEALVVAGLVVNRLVDLIRSAFDKKDRVPKAWWLALAGILGVAFAYVACHVHPIGLALHVSGGTGCVGLVLTGMGVGGIAGVWHEIMSALSSVSGAAASPKGLIPRP